MKLTDSKTQKQIKTLLEKKSNIVSLISPNFDDIELSNLLKDEYNITKIPDAMNWTNFVKWFNSVSKVKPLFSNSEKPRLMIINTDLISMIPSYQKKTTSRKSKAVTVESFINNIIYKSAVKVIFLTEKPYDQYKMKIKPTLIGVTDNINDPIVMATLIASAKERDKVMFDFRRYDGYLDLLLWTLIDHFMRIEKFEFKRYLSYYIRMYYKMQYEVPTDLIKQFIVKYFKTSRMALAVEPVHFFKNTKGELIKLLKEI